MSSSSFHNNILWASTGGGWRAMFADVGYVNVMAQAGLFPNTTNTTEEDSFSVLKSVSTVSGGSWFSTQLFFSREFYQRTALAATPDDIYDFVLQWMKSYDGISSDIDDDTRASCNFDSLYSSDDEKNERITTLRDICYVLVKYNYDWALFVQSMLAAAADDYGTADFVNIVASSNNIIAPLQKTDLLIQAALAPNSRIRRPSQNDDTAVYLGQQTNGDNNDPDKLWTVALSAAWIVDTEKQSAEFVYGIDHDNQHNSSSLPQTFTAPTPKQFSWGTWEAFHLFQQSTSDGTFTTTSPGTTLIDNTNTNIRTATAATYYGTLRTPFGSNETTTVLQVAAISSAAGATGSPLAAISFAQMLSIGQSAIQSRVVDTVWRVLAGLAAGLGVAVLLGVVGSYLTHRYFPWCYRPCRQHDGTDDIGGDAIADVDVDADADVDGDGDGDGDVDKNSNSENDDSVEDIGTNDATNNDDDHGNRTANETQTQHDDTPPPYCCQYRCCKCCQCRRPARNWGIICGTTWGILAALLTGLFYGLGSIIVPNTYNSVVESTYQNATFDNFAVCSQWPNLPCDERDAYMMDGWFVDNPALSINLGHVQTQNKVALNETIKVLLTNCNEVWDTEYNRAQYLAYFSTYFNQGVAPGEFVWGPGWFVPMRSPQVFSKYLDADGLDALLEPIEGSNMTTAVLRGMTTVDNPAYHVVAGQRVELFLMNLNANITTFVIGRSLIAEFTKPLAEMTRHIAANEELVRRVREFVSN